MLSVARGCARRPLHTGWFAGFGALEAGDFSKVAFSNDGYRFMGATFDPVGLYRFNAVARMLKTNGLTIAGIDDHVKAMQSRFLEGLAGKSGAALSPKDLIAPPDGVSGLGHFLTFRRDDADAIDERLAAKNIVVDHRGDRLRFGFGLYQDAADVDALLTHL